MKNKNLFITVAVVIIAVLVIYFSYTFNLLGAFPHDTIVNGDNYFSINFPGNYTEQNITLGTANLPLFRKIYKYDNNNTENRIVFDVVENNYPAAFSDKQINDIFINDTEGNLIQNQSNNSNGQKETIQKKTFGKYQGYPSIDAIIKVENLSVVRYVRYIKIGHLIFEIEMANDSCSMYDCNDYFYKYANTFKILLNENLKTQ